MVKCTGRNSSRREQRGSVQVKQVQLLPLVPWVEVAFAAARAATVPKQSIIRCGVTSSRKEVSEGRIPSKRPSCTHTHIAHVTSGIQPPRHPQFVLPTEHNFQRRMQRFRSCKCE
jgi:hypothetical protein